VVFPFLQPNSAERKEIAAVLLQPPSRDLTGEERQVLWRFRFSLTNEKRALTKFLKCVDWSDAQESKQATDLMHRWASIDIADALELLSPAFVSEVVGTESVLLVLV
jgi:phosphatidylinositol 3-kinase